MEKRLARHGRDLEAPAGCRFASRRCCGQRFPPPYRAAGRRTGPSAFLLPVFPQRFARGRAKRRPVLRRDQSCPRRTIINKRPGGSAVRRSARSLLFDLFMGQSFARGRATVTLKRSPSVLTMHCPPCSVQRSSAIERPSPLPSPLRALSPRTKRRVRSSAGVSSG